MEPGFPIAGTSIFSTNRIDCDTAKHAGSLAFFPPRSVVVPRSVRPRANPGSSALRCRSDFPDSQSNDQSSHNVYIVNAVLIGDEAMTKTGSVGRSGFCDVIRKWTQGIGQCSHCGSSNRSCIRKPPGVNIRRTKRTPWHPVDHCCSYDGSFHASAQRSRLKFWFERPWCAVVPIV